MCVYRRTSRRLNSPCHSCDFGEFFQNEEENRELSFEEEQSFDMARVPLTTDDDEPYYNPDDMISRIHQSEEDQDENPFAEDEDYE